MELFWKACAATLIALILMPTLSKQGHMVTMIMISVCCMTGIAAVQLLGSFFDSLYALQSEINLDNRYMDILMKITGIGLVSELITLICNDAGSASLGKNIQLLAAALVLYLSVPVFENLLLLIRDILGVL